VIPGGSGKRATSRSDEPWSVPRVLPRAMRKRKKRRERTRNNSHIYTYLQSVQVNVVERAVYARCQIMRHLDMLLTLPPVVSFFLSFSPPFSLVAAHRLHREPNTFRAILPSSTLALFLRQLLSPFSFFFLSLLSFFRYFLSRLGACEPDENTREEKGKNEDNEARSFTRRTSTTETRGALISTDECSA